VACLVFFASHYEHNVFPGMVCKGDFGAECGSRECHRIDHQGLSGVQHEELGAAIPLGRRISTQLQCMFFN